MFRKASVFLLIFLLSAALSGCGASSAEKNLEQYLQTVQDSTYIMHALGGLEGTYSYVNSIDALEANYQEGYRLYEVDVSFTSDSQLVLAHSNNGDKNDGSSGGDRWAKSDWEKKLGLPYDEDNPSMTYDEFMSITIQGKFQPSSFADLVDFVREHQDIYIMIDVGNRSYEGTKRIYTVIAETADYDDSVLEHFIVGGHTADMIQAVQEVYDFPIYNLYFADEEFRTENSPDWLDMDAFAQYCVDNGIQSYSVSSSVFSQELAEVTAQYGLISYVFTVNDQQEADALLENGATIIGTDFLR